VLDAINAALLLRRPLLVTGSPGTGKTSLIYRVAYELGLGPVLEWPVNSRSRPKDALYDYDAVARLHAKGEESSRDIGKYISLRALGTALLPATRPRVLLIDEIDKADPDLPNDLLNLFEEGSFEIPELIREKVPVARVRPLLPVSSRTTSDSKAEPKEPEEVEVKNGRIRCHEFPFVVLTSNGERQFPPAFLRRCIRVKLPDPGVEQLTRIVTAHLGEQVAERALKKIESFASEGVRTTAMDQFLNALHVVHCVSGVDEGSRAKLEGLLMQPITKL
jgi:MoxR-like ATPase